MKKALIVCMLVLAAQLSVSAQIEESWIIGVWTPGHGKARVKIEKIGNKYFGKTVWLTEPNDPETGKPKVDKNNPDPALRNTPRLGLRIMKDFVYDGNGIFSGGTIYDPEKGKTYCGKITITTQNTLDMRGFICGFKALGREDTWTRHTEN